VRRSPSYIFTNGMEAHRDRYASSKDSSASHLHRVQKELFVLR